MEGQTNQPKRMVAPPPYLRKEESAVAGLETLSTSCTQVGVSHLLTSVSVRKSEVRILDGSCIRLQKAQFSLTRQGDH